MRGRVLLVDDEPDVLESLGDLLRCEGADVLTATSAAEGLQILARQPVRLVISDFWMPGMDGCQFLKRVSELYPAVDELLITAFPHVLEQAGCDLEEGQCLQKPVEPVTFLRTVEELLA